MPPFICKPAKSRNKPFDGDEAALYAHAEFDAGRAFERIVPPSMPVTLPRYADRRLARRHCRECGSLRPSFRRRPSRRLAADIDRPPYM